MELSSTWSKMDPQLTGSTLTSWVALRTRRRLRFSWYKPEKNYRLQIKNSDFSRPRFMASTLGSAFRRFCVQSTGPLWSLETVNITMIVVFIQKWFKLYLGHGFYVKWAGTDVRGFVSSREAAKFCPELLIKFYQSRITWNDKEELAVKLRVWALDLKVKLLKPTNPYLITYFLL